MDKIFRDLNVGDYVWIIDGYEISKVEVTEIQKSLTLKDVYYISLSFLNNPYPYHICRLNLRQKRNGNLFLIKEEAIEHLKKKLEKRKQTLEKKIDSLISEFDALDSISMPPTVKPSTIIPSMKELKLKDSVWYVDKFKLKVKKTRILEIQKKSVSWYYMNCLKIKTPISSFITYPNASRSTRLDYYTTEEQAWRYMLEWRKSRMKTVGNEMEKLMKELEKYEEVW